MSGAKVPKNAVRKQMVQEERCKTLYLSRDDNPKRNNQVSLWLGKLHHFRLW